MSALVAAVSSEDVPLEAHRHGTVKRYITARRAAVVGADVRPGKERPYEGRDHLGARGGQRHHHAVALARVPMTGSCFRWRRVSTGPVSGAGSTVGCRPIAIVE